MPRFGKDKDARNEELDRQAAEEVERLTRRGMGGGGMGGGMPGMGGGPPRITPPSPLEMMAAEVADRPRAVRQGAAPRRPAPRAQQGFTPMPSGGVGSSFGPGGLNPGPRGGFSAPPPPSFGGGGAYEEDYGGHVTGPSVYNAEPDEDEEMSITEMAIMDHAARTGHNPEDLVMMYDAGTAEEMRDRAMRQFYERQASRRPSAGTNDPFAPAGTRRGPAGPATAPRRADPAAAGGALAQRLAARRRQEEEQSRRAAPAPAPAPAPTVRATRPTSPSAAAPAPAERQVDEGALARVLARRRAALGVDAPSPPAVTEEPDEAETGARHAAARGPLRSVPTEAEATPAGDEAPPAAKKAAAKRTTKKAAAAKAEAAPAPIAMPAAGDDAPPAKKAAAKRSATKAAAAPAEAKAPAKKATKKAAATKAPSARKGGATLATPAPAVKKAPAKKAAGKAKTIFCIECGEKNPVIAKFCFNCGTRLAAPEG